MKNPNKIPNNKKPFKALATAALASAAIVGSIGGEASAARRPQHNSAVKAETPFKVLTGIVADLEKGGQVKVPDHNIHIPGPIETSVGRPVVFKDGRQTYFAYTQGQKPNFDQKRPADVAGEMAIIKEPTTDKHIPLEEAHLNKLGELINENEMGVGYSKGGDMVR